MGIISNKSLQVDFACLMTFPGEGEAASQDRSEFLRENKRFLNGLNRLFQLYLPCSSLTQLKHPTLQYEFVDDNILIVRYSFCYWCLRDANLMIDFLKSAFDIICWQHYKLDHSFDYILY